MGRLDGKTTLIAGGGTGMGRACALLFAEHGAKVVIAGRRPGTLAEVRCAIETAGGTCVDVVADVSIEDECARLVDRTVVTFGRLDVLVNAAAMGGNAYRESRPGGMEALGETPSEHWHELITNNLDSVYYLCKHALGVMRPRNRGSIINFGSVSAVHGGPQAHAYAVVKGGIHTMTRQLATRYAREGIRTNCICPGPVDTPMMVGSPSISRLAPDREDRFTHNPMGRPGQPEEIAYGALFLASDEASYVNGAVLPIDGGALSCPT